MAKLFLSLLSHVRGGTVPFLLFLLFWEGAVAGAPAVGSLVEEATEALYYPTYTPSTNAARSFSETVLIAILRTLLRRRNTPLACPQRR